MFGTFPAFLFFDSEARLEFWAAVGAVFGVVLFLRGFKMLRFKRLILNTPASKIRSAAMGLVEITGTASGPYTIPAGLTGDSCFYYRAMAWQLKQEGRGSEWKRVADEALCVPFFIEDTTGRMLVNPEGADLDVERNFKDEVGSTYFASGAMSPSVRSFLLRNGLAGMDHTRIEEYCIKPDHALFVLGTLCKNTLYGDWKPSAMLANRMSLKSRMNPFGPLGSFGTQILGVSFGITSSPSTIRPSEVSVTPTRSSALKPGLAPTTPSNASVTAAAASTWSTVSMDDTQISRLNAAIARHTASTLQAPAALAAPTTVTVAEPPEAVSAATTPALPAVDEHGFETNPSVAIGCGTQGQPFAISWQSQRDMVAELAWKSTLCIWGGPVLTLVSLYVLCVCFEWISL